MDQCAHVPPAKTSTIPSNSEFGNLSILAECFLDMYIGSIESHVADEDGVAPRWRIRGSGGFGRLSTLLEGVFILSDSRGLREVSSERQHRSGLCVSSAHLHGERGDLLSRNSDNGRRAGCPHSCATNGLPIKFQNINAFSTIKLTTRCDTYILIERFPWKE